MALTLVVDDRPDGRRVRLSGDLLLAEAGVLAEALDGVGQAPRLVVDLSAVARCDGAGAALVAAACTRWEQAGARVVVEDGSRAAALVAAVRRPPVEHRPAPPAGGMLARLGAHAAGLGASAGAGIAALGALAASLPGALRRPRSAGWREVPALVTRAGADGLAVVALANLLVGAIMGFQGVVQLQAFGATAFVPDALAIVILREMGPMITAVIVAGRSGAGFAAELGTMVVGEEVDALRTMGLDPWRWLVWPRLAALLVALPILTLAGMACGLAGGMVAALPMTELGAGGFLQRLGEAAALPHFLIGMAKPPLFALAIALIACAQGLAARGGAAAVGGRTTAAVVLTIVAVIALDAVCAVACTALGW
jgi:phospholipid/cholesterol/gamma-HCH transport system permease protein